MATSYLSPGVYVEEVDRGPNLSRWLVQCGRVYRGEQCRPTVNEPVLCTNWSQYTKTFGDFQSSEYLAHAVYGFFNNGGGRCYVLNVGGAEATDAKKDDKKTKDAKAGAPKSDAALFIGTDNGPGARTGLKAFEDVEDINIVCAPGQTDPAIQDAVLSHCENMRYRFAILDSAEELEKGGVSKIAKPRDSKYGSFYFPWVEVYDPYKGNIHQPPSGYMAGIYARSDGERGVHKRRQTKSFGEPWG